MNQKVLKLQNNLSIYTCINNTGDIKYTRNTCCPTISFPKMKVKSGFE